MNWDKRGRTIESYLTDTEYRNWTRTDHLIDTTSGKHFANNFTLIDFVDFDANVVVSLKSANTTSSTFLARHMAVVDDLAHAPRLFEIGPAGLAPRAVVLDLRVQPGGIGKDTQRLIQYGRQQGMIVRVKEFPN